MTMHNLRMFGLVALGLAGLMATAFLTVSLALLAGAVMTATLVWRSLAMKAKPVPVYARARASNQPRREMRVWNDGRGTIIDL
ncbi:hypothetical protein [Allorhizobium undicola]|uniref:hypothetical protein n=1 Tax=Allorhizobium undicola TaxID=78527 RepID=UPI001FDAA583